MASNDPLVINQESSNNSSNPLDLDVRKNRLTLWCIVYYIYAVTSLAATSLLLKNVINEYSSKDWEKHANRMYIAGACFILLAAVITMIYLHYTADKQIFKFVAGAFFIIGGILHISANSTIIHNVCVERASINIIADDNWCRIMILFPDFMAQYLSIIMGLDIITVYGDDRKIRLIAYNAVLCICMLLAGGWANHNYNKDYNLPVNIDDDSTTVQVGLFTTGIICGLLFIVLLIHFIIKKELNHKHKENVHRLIAFILLSAIGLVFINGMVLYQMLFVLMTVVLIAYDLQFV